MTIFFLSPEGESSLVKSRWLTGGDHVQRTDSQRKRRWNVSDLASGSIPYFLLDVDTRKPEFPSKPTRPEAWSSSQKPGQGMEPVAGSAGYQRPSEQSFLGVPGPGLLT